MLLDDRDERARKLTDRYDAHAAAYQELWAPILRPAALHVLGALEAVPVSRIADIGTGVGSIWDDLRARFPSASVVGIDRSPGMLARAPAVMPRVIADAVALPLVDGSIDLALLVFMLFHLADPAAGLREVRRALRPGGRVAIATWGTDLESAATRIWTGSLDEHGAAPPDPAIRARDELMDTPHKMQALLRVAGFSNISTWTDDLVEQIELERLLSLRTRMGSEKARFDSLDAQTQAACVATARRRMEALKPSDFIATAHVVYAVAS